MLDFTKAISITTYPTKESQMCNAHNHPADCTCGWGGDGHLGRRTEGNFSSSHIENSNYRTLAESMTLLAKARGRPVVIPQTCKYCGQDVYFYANEHGSRVFFDILGKPWTKHCCDELPDYIRSKVLKNDDYDCLVNNKKSPIQENRILITNNEVKLKQSLELPKFHNKTKFLKPTTNKTSKRKNKKQKSGTLFIARGKHTTFGHILPFDYKIDLSKSFNDKKEFISITVALQSVSNDFIKVSDVSFPNIKANKVKVSALLRILLVLLNPHNELQEKIKKHERFPNVFYKSKNLFDSGKYRNAYLVMLFFLATVVCQDINIKTKSRPYNSELDLLNHIYPHFMQSSRYKVLLRKNYRYVNNFLSNNI